MVVTNITPHVGSFTFLDAQDTGTVSAPNNLILNLLEPKVISHCYRHKARPGGTYLRLAKGSNL